MAADQPQRLSVRQIGSAGLGAHWQVVAAPEILTVIREIPNLQEFLSSIYDCKYAPAYGTAKPTPNSL